MLNPNSRVTGIARLISSQSSRAASQEQTARKSARGADALAEKSFSSICLATGRQLLHALETLGDRLHGCGGRFRDAIPRQTASGEKLELEALDAESPPRHCQPVFRSMLLHLSILGDKTPNLRPTVLFSFGSKLSGVADLWIGHVNLSEPRASNPLDKSAARAGAACI